MWQEVDALGKSGQLGILRNLEKSWETLEKTDTWVTELSNFNFMGFFCFFFFRAEPRAYGSSQARG